MIGVQRYRYLNLAKKSFYKICLAKNIKKKINDEYFKLLAYYFFLLTSTTFNNIQIYYDFVFTLLQHKKNTI